MQAKKSQSFSQSILRLESEKRTVVQTPVPYAGSSELVCTVRDRSGWQDGQGPLFGIFPIRPWREPSYSFWRLSSGTRKQQKLNLGRQWSVVSRIDSSCPKEHGSALRPADLLLGNQGCEFARGLS